MVQANGYELALVESFVDRFCKAPGLGYNSICDQESFLSLNCKLCIEFWDQQNAQDLGYTLSEEGNLKRETRE